MTDTFNVTASFDKTQYNKGDTMTLTITGGASNTTVTQETVSGTIDLTAADGSTETIPLPSGVTVNVTTTTAETVIMGGIVDSARTWTVAANGTVATAVA